MKAQHTPQARTGSALNWIVVNPEGCLLAVLDSESEAHFFKKNRGHANGAVHFKALCDYAAAPELLEACKAQHLALDVLMAQLIRAEPNFFPSKSEAWRAVVQGADTIAKAEAAS